MSPERPSQDAGATSAGKAAGQGAMVIVSSPSGAGKSTLTRSLLHADPHTRLSISATTRAKRPHEEDGVHYHFIDDARFDALLAEKAFLEWAPVFDHRYGTLRSAVEPWLEQGHDVIFDIDWQGARQLRASAFTSLVSIFILPPSLEELERRLRGRGGDAEAVIQRRMSKAVDEISHWAEYDYVIINNDLERAKRELAAIVETERATRHGISVDPSVAAVADGRRFSTGGAGDKVVLQAFVDELMRQHSSGDASV